MKETQTITKSASGHARESPSRVDTTRWLSNAAGRRTACTNTGTAFDNPEALAYAYNMRSELTNAVSNVDANYAYSYDYAPFGAEIVPVGVEAEDSTTVHYSLSPIRCSNFGFTVDEIRDLYYAWTAPEKPPRHVRRTFELEARKHITGSKSRSAVSSSEMQKAIKELGYKKLRNKLTGKAGGKALKALAPNAVPVIGQVVSMLMTASEVRSVCRCAWACSVSKFF